MRTRTIGHAQTRAEVVRIGHAVEHQDQRRFNFLDAFEQLVQRMGHLDFTHARGHALVSMTAREFGQTWAIGLNQTNPRVGGTVHELTHARIAACGVEVNFDDGLRRCFHAHTDGVKAEENFRGR